MGVDAKVYIWSLQPIPEPILRDWRDNLGKLCREVSFDYIMNSVDKPYHAAPVKCTRYWYDLGIQLRYFGREYEKCDPIAIREFLDLMELLKSNLPEAEFWYGNDLHLKSLDLFDEVKYQELDNMLSLILTDGPRY